MFAKSMMKNAYLPKISILLQFGGEILDSDITPLEHNRANISLPDCNEMPIFGKEAFFIILFQNISTNPIISKIKFL